MKTLSKKKSLLTAAALTASLALTACGTDTKTKASDPTALDQVTTPDTYPIETDVTLRYWMQLPAQVSAQATSMNDTELSKYLAEETGIKVSFEHPVAGQEAAAFNILQASGDAPDIIEWSWAEYPGGPQGAINDKLIIPLDSYIEKVSPNLKSLLEKNPEWKKSITSSEGHIYEYPFIKDNPTLLTYMTYTVRQDLLDRAGLSAPVTFEDWETMLYKFKDMGIASPISLRLTNFYLQYCSPFTSKFGIVGGWYQKNGKVQFGPAQEEFGDYIKMLKRWYDDGILDREFADITPNRITAGVTNGNIGSLYCSVGGELGNYLSALPAGSSIKLSPVTVPVERVGETPMWGQKDYPVVDCAAISYDSKHKELAARFLDYGYSEKGELTYNFGRENVSYTYQDSDRGSHLPTYTAQVTDKNANGGLSLAQGIAKYARACYSGPFVQDLGYLYQYYTRPEQQAAFDVWGSDALNYKLPKNLIYEGDEESRFKDIMTAVDTYREESLAKFIAGKTDIGQLDNYFAQLKSLGIGEAISIQQKAYDRYQSLAD